MRKYAALFVCQPHLAGGGGDITNGGSTVVQAVADGMRAANAIHQDM